MNATYQLLLASQSPRRKELLAYLGYPFQVVNFPVKELSEKVLPKDIVEDLAKVKAEAVSVNGDKVVITADTIVTDGKKIFGKPENEDHAREILMALSGREYQVLTGVCIQKFPDKLIEVFSVSTKVWFSSLNKKILDQYISSNEYADKAGAYGIQGAAQVFIEKIEGSYSNVVGLPLFEVGEKLKKYEITL